MENIILGLQAIQKLMRIEIGVMISSSLIQGFLIGFFVGTLVFAFVSEKKGRKGTKSEKKNGEK